MFGEPRVKAFGKMKKQKNKARNVRTSEKKSSKRATAEKKNSSCEDENNVSHKDKNM